MYSVYIIMQYIMCTYVKIFLFYVREKLYLLKTVLEKGFLVCWITRIFTKDYVYTEKRNKKLLYTVVNIEFIEILFLPWILLVVIGPGLVVTGIVKFIIQREYCHNIWLFERSNVKISQLFCFIYINENAYVVPFGQRNRRNVVKR